MLGRIRKLKGLVSLILLLLGATALASCATEQQRTAGLVSDPDQQKTDSMIPWNKQEKWESSGSLGGITDRR